MTSLETRGYVATVADIERMTSEHDAARTVTASTGGIYLRALVATVQSELGVAVRERAARTDGATLGDEEVARHLEAFESVNTRFYGVVLRGLTGDSLEKNSKSGFARSAASALRRWMRSGHDISRLAARSVTRDALEAAIPASTKRVPRVRVTVLKKRGSKGLGLLVSAASAADKGERGAGVAMLEAALGSITAALVKLGGVAVARSADVGVRDRVPFKKGNDVFWPVSS